MAGPVHYEIYIRKTAPSPWSLLMATEDRARAIETAEDLLADRRAAAVRVTKEMLDPDTMEFTSITLMTRGAPEVKQKRAVPVEDAGPRCAGPEDFYSPYAREIIGRVLEDWLGRQGVTAFELLHRPDLAEQLEASGTELQHAIQKVAIPESQSVGQSLHDLLRHYQRLSDKAIERLVSAGRRGLFPDLESHSLADIAHRVSASPDRGLIMGGVISRALIDSRGGRQRLDRLMDLAERAPMEGSPRALVMVAVEQVLCETVAVRGNLSAILGPALDQGATLAAVVRLVAPREVEALIANDARMALHVPPVSGPAARLGVRLEADEFPLLAAALSRMVVRELISPRRLRPNDAPGEIEILRTLALSLSAAAGRLLTLEEVQKAFAERSKSLVIADFVAAYVQDCETVLGEAERLVRLCENVTGPANKRAAARWLTACVNSLRFESEMRAPGLSPSQKLAMLARLQRSVRGAALGEHDAEVLCGTFGTLGGMVETEARLVIQLGKAPAPIQQKLTLLLRLAAGETAPLGPAADRAKAEALRLLRAPDSRATLAADPAALAPLRGLMKAAGLAA
tara:strand:+ start:563 stop:2275 length:1713 start_codon:yes stop_codon:yes gene_type:complete